MKLVKAINTLTVTIFAMITIFILSNSAEADVLGVFDNSWTVFASEDVTSNFVDPGWGGQAFDAEYLLYDLDGDILSIGLQTGFDIATGNQLHNGTMYYSGDLALSFDGATIGNSSTYEYAVDFGLTTKDYYDNPVGIGDGDQDTEGVYSVSQWNLDNDVDSGIYFNESNPFAMDEGAIVTDALVANSTNTNDLPINSSYFRKVQIDLSKILGVDWAHNGFNLDAHWTMSCGNDAINGHLDVTPVPEPATLLLVGSGIVGILTRRKKK